MSLNGPDTRVVVIRWSVKSTTGRMFKVIAQQDFPRHDIAKISVHPLDRTLLTTTGRGLFKQWNIDEIHGQIGPYQMEITGLPTQDLTFTDHLWTEERQLVVCTKQGDIFVLQINNVV